MITTIQIRESVKTELDRLKTGKETYEQIILQLMKIAEYYKRKQRNLLIESCKVMGKDSLKITKEFEAIENLDSWKW